jgi:hypothetical protein
MAAPNTIICAACGASGDLQEHHLIPRVCGGSSLPTVMLCVECHGLVHGRPFAIRHSELTRLGLAAAKARGVKLGNPNLHNIARRFGDARIAREARSAKAKQYAEDVAPLIEAARAAGCNSLGELARALTARGIETPAGSKTWNSKQVSRILARASQGNESLKGQ